MMYLALTENVQGYITETMALAAVALIGYLFGHRTRQPSQESGDDQLHLELSRAAEIAKELHQVAQRIRQDVASHQSSIAQFKARVNRLAANDASDGWQALSKEAESLLAPTMKLATNLSLAYDQLRKQSTQLMNFAGSRSDPLTGVHNRRAMEEQLDVLFSLHEQNKSRFALSQFSIESTSAEQRQEKDTDKLLQSFAELLANCARDTDLVARYSSDEFVVLMPQTTLAGATVFSERLIKRATDKIGCVTYCGAVEVLAEDTPEKLLSRADSALYSARANGVSCLFQHNGKTIRPHEADSGSDDAAPASDESPKQPDELDAPEAAESSLCLNGQSAAS